MKVLVVENEIYLAQNISAKLSENGFSCDIVTTLNDALSAGSYDIVLLSTNISGQNFYPIIDKYKETIIILMISYISNDTVAKPLKAGAKDYILKPFMMDELIRKIQHFGEFERTKRENRFYGNYIANMLDVDNVDVDVKRNPPFMVVGSSQKNIDAYVIAYAKKKGYNIEYLALSRAANKTKPTRVSEKALLYITGFEELKKGEKKELFENLDSTLYIISSLEEEFDFDIKTVNIKSQDVASFDSGGEILSVDEYIRIMIVNFQNKYPDTELSKKLGMSRKSLWEKRKKYGIQKRK